MSLKQILSQEFFLFTRSQLKNSLKEKRFKDHSGLQEEMQNLKIYESSIKQEMSLSFIDSDLD